MTAADPPVIGPNLTRRQHLGCLAHLVTLIVVTVAVGVWLGGLR